MRNQDLTKALLDENIVDEYVICEAEHVYVSKIGNDIFAYVRLDEILVPECTSGDYRVCRGDFYTDEHVFFVEN